MAVESRHCLSLWVVLLSKMGREVGRIWMTESLGKENSETKLFKSFLSNLINAINSCFMKCGFPVVSIFIFFFFHYIPVCVRCLHINAVFAAVVIVIGEHLTIVHNLLLLNSYISGFRIICLNNNINFYISR